MQLHPDGDSLFARYPAPSRWPIYAGTLIPALWFPFIGWAIGFALTLLQVDKAKKQNIAPQLYWEAFAISFLITLVMTCGWLAFT